MTDDRDPDPLAATVAYFDGGCPVCRREVAAYRRMPGTAAIAWADAADPRTPLPGIERSAALARFHVRRADGRVASGAAAFLAVWRRNPRLRRLAVCLDRPPFRAGLELAYRAFLRLRRIWRRPDDQPSAV